MEKNIELALENSRYNVLRLNQYSKGFNIKCNLMNYTYREGDVASIEFNLNNKSYFIQNTNISIEDSVVTFKLAREVTLNAGKGLFNVVITNGDSRTSNFKAELEVIGNSIDENTVSSTFVITAKEELDESITNANEKITELNNLISNTTVEGLNSKVDKEEGKGLSTNDFTNAYKNKVNSNKISIDNITTSLNKIIGNDTESPTGFELSCATTDAIKHASSTHNWYIVRNGICFLHLDLDIVNANITTVVAIEGLPLLFSSTKEVWDNIVGQGTNVSSNLSIKLSADTNTTTLTIDKATTKGRYMGTIVYPIATNNVTTVNTEE